MHDMLVKIRLLDLNKMNSKLRLNNDQRSEGSWKISGSVTSSRLVKSL